MNHKDEQINHDNHHGESKTRTHRLSKLSDDGDPKSPNNLLKSGEKEKHQLNPGGQNNRQGTPVPNNINQSNFDLRRKDQISPFRS